MRATHILKIEIAATVGGIVATEISIGNMWRGWKKFAKTCLKLGELWEFEIIK